MRECVSGGAVRVSEEAKIMRADGTVEELGVISKQEIPPQVYLKYLVRRCGRWLQQQRL